MNIDVRFNYKGNVHCPLVFVEGKGGWNSRLWTEFTARFEMKRDEGENEYW